MTYQLKCACASARHLKVFAGQVGISQEEKAWCLLLPGTNPLCYYPLKPLAPPKLTDLLLFFLQHVTPFYADIFLFWIFELAAIPLLSEMSPFLSCIALHCSFSSSALNLPVSAAIWVKDIQLHPITAEPLWEGWRKVTGERDGYTIFLENWGWLVAGKTRPAERDCSNHYDCLLNTVVKFSSMTARV